MEPLRIDVLVIKKRPEVVVKKQIAEIFRQENIVEYKNPKKLNRAGFTGGSII
jgi:hypothetical protein